MDLKKEIQKLLKKKIRLRVISQVSGIPIPTVWKFAYEPDREVTYDKYNRLLNAVILLKGRK